MNGKCNDNTFVNTILRRDYFTKATCKIDQRRENAGKQKRNGIKNVVEILKNWRKKVKLMKHIAKLSGK